MHPYWRHCRRKPHEDDPDDEAAKMTATLSIVRGTVAEDVACESEQPRNAAADAPEKAWDPLQFAQEQIRGLVRRVFLQGWPRPARQVVFSSAGSLVEVASVCRKAGEVLAAERAGRVALVEANVRTKALELSFGRTSNDGEDSTETAGALRKSSRQVGRNLWLVSAVAFLGCGENGNNSAWLLSRLGELRREFDFALIHASPAGEADGSAVFLGHLADGLVLALDAHRTRRRSAMRIREQLSAANVRLLGTVLRDRVFPIPEKLYRRL
jgi:Mrp family chromosome partitioning ATPase